MSSPAVTPTQPKVLLPGLAQQAQPSNTDDLKPTNPTKPTIPLDKGQKELIEIMNDFKSDVLSIDELGNLLKQWHSRNENPQSHEERQEQLKEMRRQYELLQMKRPSTFERFKNFFSRSKPKENNAVEVDKLPPSVINPEEKVGSYLATHNLRPTSSLSLQSTASKFNKLYMSNILYITLK